MTAVVSKGPERHAVPTVAGLSVDDATHKITDASLKVGPTTSVYDDKVPTGRVVSTNPAADTDLKRGQSVALVVSKGPAPVKLPNLVGKPADQATTTLQKAGLKVTSTTAYSKTVPAGSVVSMAPKAGVSVPKGGTVALVVSKGPPPVTVPDVYRVPEADARKQLQALGFVVRIGYPIGFTPFGRVVTQSAKAGSQLPYGSTISLDVV